MKLKYNIIKDKKYTVGTIILDLPPINLWPHNDIFIQMSKELAQQKFIQCGIIIDYWAKNNQFMFDIWDGQRKNLLLELVPVL